MTKEYLSAMNRKIRKPIKFLLFMIICLVFLPFIPCKQESSSLSYQHTNFKTLSTLEAWQKINPDIFALLQFSTSDIIHQIPIIYTDKGDHYMVHDPFGNYDTMGSVFMEKQLCPIDDSNNFIINGHSSKTKNWNFTFLKNYSDQAYFQENPEFLFIDAKGTHQYRIISFSEYDLDDPSTYLDWHNNYFASYEQLKTMLDATLPYVINRIDGFYYQNQQLITLVTCNMQKPNARYVLLAYENTERNPS